MRELRAISGVSLRARKTAIPIVTIGCRRQNGHKDQTIQSSTSSILVPGHRLGGELGDFDLDVGHLVVSWMGVRCYTERRYSSTSLCKVVRLICRMSMKSYLAAVANDETRSHA